MNRILKAILLGLILAACKEEESLTVNTEWTQISNWGEESFARCIAVKGSTVFVGTDQEIYRSTNNGDTWTKLPPYTEVAHLNGLRRLYIKANTLFGGEPVDGFIKSTDNGKTWAKVSSSIPENETVESIASNLNYMFLGTYGAGLFRSNDNGHSWENIFETASVGEPIGNIAVDETNVLILIPKKGLYLSIDNGFNWHDITGDLNVDSGVGAIYIKDQTILIGTDKFLKSNDLGTTWQEITQENGFEVPGSLLSITSMENTIYASTGYDAGAGIFYSNDNGESWIKTPIKTEFHTAVFNLVVNENYVFGIDQYNVHRISRTP